MPIRVWSLALLTVTAEAGKFVSRPLLNTVFASRLGHAPRMCAVSSSREEIVKKTVAFQQAHEHLNAALRAKWLVTSATESGPPILEEKVPQACKPLPHWLEEAYEVVERGTIPGLLLVASTALSLILANMGRTSSAWLRIWSSPAGPMVAGHVLSLRGWVNEGLMAIFFFVVGLEIKMELRLGSLASIRKAILPCVAALGGMLTPMAVYMLVQTCMTGGTMAALTVGLLIPIVTHPFRVLSYEPPSLS